MKVLSTIAIAATLAFAMSAQAGKTEAKGGKTPAAATTETAAPAHGTDAHATMTKETAMMECKKEMPKAKTAELDTCVSKKMMH